MACTTPTTNAALSSDPTQTRDLREAFVAEIGRRFTRLRGLIRRTLGYEHDAFGLSTNVEPTEVYDYPTDQGKIRAFMEDFRRWLLEVVTEPVGLGPTRQGRHWTAQYIRAAYGRGWQQATGRLMQEGISVTAEGGIESVLQLPVAERQLRQLYARTFENVRDISSDTESTVRRELVTGLAEGVNPREMARRITKEVRDIENKRAKTLARSEVINSHSTATLDRYEQAGVGTVEHGEWATAGDDRVCPICEALEGREFTIGEFRTGTFEFDAKGEDVPDYLAGTYRLKPPAHPNGRCSIYPVVQ